MHDKHPPPPQPAQPILIARNLLRESIDSGLRDAERMLAERRPAGEKVSQRFLVVEMSAVLRFCRVVCLAHFVEEVEGAGRATD